jgi:hypothetical protein
LVLGDDPRGPKALDLTPKPAATLPRL